LRACRSNISERDDSQSRHLGELYEARAEARGEVAESPKAVVFRKDPGCGPVALKTKKPPNIEGFQVEAPGIETCCG
jgi:hypothetical protein